MSEEDDMASVDESAPGGRASDVGAPLDSMPEVIAILEVGLSASDPKVMRACIHAALDYARNDKEALAEGATWADPPSSQTEAAVARPHDEQENPQPPIAQRGAS